MPARNQLTHLRTRLLRAAAADEAAYATYRSAASLPRNTRDATDGPRRGHARGANCGHR